MAARDWRRRADRDYSLSMNALSRLREFLAEERWEFAPHERPMMPGSPGSPDHPNRRRVLYGLVAVLVGLTGGLGNGLISANTTILGGALGLDPVEVAWLPTIYVATNVSINLLLIKFRQQFGLRPFAVVFLALYLLLTVAHLFVQDFASALLVRAASGMAAAPLTTFALYYMMQAFPAKWRLRAVVLGIGLPQCATPLARLFSPELLAMDQWRALYLFECGLAALSLAAVLLVRLPPTERIKAFEPLDFVTFVLFGSAAALTASVLGLGRIVWWTNAPWIAWALIGAIVLFAAAVLIEHHRTNPLLNTRWLASADIMRFAIVTMMARIVLSEQNVGVVGLLNTLGLNNDELGPFFLVLLLASVAGVVLSAATLDLARLSHPVVLAIGLVAVAAFIDSHSTSQTRPQQLYLTQATIAFAGTFFLGPALIFGMFRALKEGTGHIISFIALFGIVNSLGGLAGSALLGTYQVAREQENSAALVETVVPSDPLVQQRLRAGAAGLAPVIGDPTLRGAASGAQLSGAVRREANVLAYNDVFRLISVLAGLTFFYMLFLLLRRHWRERRDKAAAL
ncbi:MFS transporter [Croceibacterium sp. TMG7-5b_MA50]|uniref:MFS transporter n=1 Tax=Croceibacterium sp. TMG7-5b_MA50 TaxID=3121290 RepID=UPI0032215890